MLSYVKPYWRRLGAIAALSLFSTALSLAIPYLSKALVDRALVGRSLAALYWTVALFAATSVAAFAISTITGLTYTRVSADILFDMRLALYRHLQQLSPRFYARTPLGEIVARINNDVGEIQRVGAESVLAWGGNVFYLAGSAAAMLWLDVRLALFALLIVPASAWTLSRVRTTLIERVRRLREASAAVGTFLIERLQATRVVVTSNAQQREAARFRRRNDRFVDALMSMQLWSSLAGSLPGLVLTIGYAALFVYGGRRVIEGTLTLGTFVAFLAYQMRLAPPVQALMGLYASFATASVSVSRVQELLDAVPDVVERRDARALPEVSGSVEFEGVSIDLGRGDILRDVSFAIAPGEIVAIVGPSGAGKSTIADLVVRLLDPDRGAIRIDGHDLRDVRLADLRRHVAIVDQEAFVFHASIAENIRYADPHADNHAVRQAAEDAGLAEFIARLPDGYDTVVGERGAALSAGERQRIAIARALVAGPSVIVLDEPTASLDPATERQLLSTLEALRGHTILVVTHRLALAEAADRVLVVADRGIVEEGTPEDLRGRAGAFATLFAIASFGAARIGPLEAR